jgi:hypothetical protein
MSSYLLDTTLGHDRRDGLQFSLTLPDGQVVRLPQKNTDGAGRIGALGLEAGEKYEQVLILDEWRELNAPGKYFVELQIVEPILGKSGESVAVNALSRAEVEVGPRNEERLKNCAESLKPIDVYTDYGDAATPAVALSLSATCRRSIPDEGDADKTGSRMVGGLAIVGLVRIANGSLPTLSFQSRMRSLADLAPSYVEKRTFWSPWPATNSLIQRW